MFFTFFFESRSLGIYSWLFQVFVAGCRLSLAAAIGGCSLGVVQGFSRQELGAQALGRGLRSCGTWAPEHRPEQFWCMGLVAPRHVESSWTRDQTHVSCISRWILNHWTTREVPFTCILSSDFMLTAPCDMVIIAVCLILQRKEADHGTTHWPNFLQTEQGSGAQVFWP